MRTPELFVRIRRHVDNLRRVTDRPRRQEKLFKQTFSAFRHRTNTKAVGKNLGADTAGAVVDRKGVANTVEGERERVFLTVDLVVELRKSLDGLDLVVIDDCEFTERLVAIGLDRVRTIRTCRKISAIRTGDDRVQIRMHDVVVGVEHLEDRRSGGSRAVYWINRVVIEDWMSTGRLHRCSVGVLLCSEREVFFGYLAAIPLSTTRLDVDRAKQAHRQ